MELHTGKTSMLGGGGGAGGGAGGSEAIQAAAKAAGSVAICCGLKAPEGGWNGPFGFFRLLTYGLCVVSALAVLLAVVCLLTFDVFGVFASILLVVGAAAAALAAYSHEGLSNEVSNIAKQNEELSKQSSLLEEQAKALGPISQKLDSITKDLGVDSQELEATLDSLHRQTAISQLSTMLSSFVDADRGGQADQRLTHGEIEDFFDSSQAVLRGACPSFDFEKLKALSLNVGIGLYAMRFMVNALIAADDEHPYKSAAELSLIMYCFDPEGQLETTISNVALALGDKSQAQIRQELLDKKAKFAKSNEHGRIPCKELHDLSHRIMTSEYRLSR